MTYKFKCPDCKNEENREIPMAYYNEQKNNQICKCGSVMERVIEFGGAVELCKGMYGTDKSGGWNH